MRSERGLKSCSLCGAVYSDRIDDTFRDDVRKLVELLDRSGVYSATLNKVRAHLDDKVKTFTDTERLDLLQKLTKGYGNGWILRNSSQGRGLRLHETSLDSAVKNVRQAIDNYLNAHLDGEVEHGEHKI